jgi:hypothetical protein
LVPFAEGAQVVVQIEYRLNGHKVLPHRLASALQASLLDDTTKQVQSALGALACPTHRRPATVLAEGTSVYGLSFTVRGCCPPFTERATQRLQGQLGDRRAALTPHPSRPEHAA